MGFLTSGMSVSTKVPVDPNPLYSDCIASFHRSQLGDVSASEYEGEAVSMSLRDRPIGFPFTEVIKLANFLASVLGTALIWVLDTVYRHVVYVSSPWSNLRCDYLGHIHTAFGFLGGKAGRVRVVFLCGFVFRFVAPPPYSQFVPPPLVLLSGSVDSSGMVGSGWSSKRIAIGSPRVLCELYSWGFPHRSPSVGMVIISVDVFRSLRMGTLAVTHVNGIVSLVVDGRSRRICPLIDFNSSWLMYIVFDSLY